MPLPSSNDHRWCEDLQISQRALKKRFMCILLKFGHLNRFKEIFQGTKKMCFLNCIDDRIADLILC